MREAQFQVSGFKKKLEAKVFPNTNTGYGTSEEDDDGFGGAW